MTITAQVICDSISQEGIRLTTFQLRYPRFIHSELMTHRQFSRNASSSRAIPVAKMIEDLKRDPARPIYWGSNKPGMQAGAELTGHALEMAQAAWLVGMEKAIFYAEQMIEWGLHKQIANRILEPWAHINVIVTATSYDNFFELRRHPDAQPEIKMLAYMMYEQLQISEPIELHPGDWHLPYIKADDWDAAHWFLKMGRVTRDEPPYAQKAELLKKVSTARCARVSYLTHDGRETTVEEDIALHDKLVGSIPLHASPAEHQATPDSLWEDDGKYKNPHLHGNFTGWNQYRKELELA